MKPNQEQNKPWISLCTMGHVNHGKSTLISYLLYALGEINKTRIDRIGEELKREGLEDRKLAKILDIESDRDKKTISKRTVRVHSLSFHTDIFNVNVVDLPGHYAWVAKGIRGVVNSDAGLLVISAYGKDFLEGLQRYKLKENRYFIGQAREYAFIAANLGLLDKVIVIISKMDLVHYSYEKYKEVKEAALNVLKEYGFSGDKIAFIPTSVAPLDIVGENITEKSMKMPWYEGDTLLQAINNITIPSSQVDKPLRFFIDDIYEPAGEKLVLRGTLKTGRVKIGDKLVIEPSHIAVEVKSIRTKDQNELEALAGTMPTIGLRGSKVDLKRLKELKEKKRTHEIAGHFENSLKVVSEFIGEIYVLWHASPIKQDFGCEIHIGPQMANCKITALFKKTSITTNTSEDNPSSIWTGDKAKIKVKLGVPLCVEPHKKLPSLGTFFLRTQGITIAAGIVTELLETRSEP